MVGRELFVATLEAETITAEDVLSAASASMGVEAASLLLLLQGSPVEPETMHRRQLKHVETCANRIGKSFFQVPAMIWDGG